MWATPLVHAHQLSEHTASQSVTLTDLYTFLTEPVSTHLPGLCHHYYFRSPLSCPRSPLHALLLVVAHWQELTLAEVAPVAEVILAAEVGVVLLGSPIVVVARHHLHHTHYPRMQLAQDLRLSSPSSYLTPRSAYWPSSVWRWHVSSYQHTRSRRRTAVSTTSSHTQFHRSRFVCVSERLCVRAWLGSRVQVCVCMHVWA